MAIDFSNLSLSTPTSIENEENTPSSGIDFSKLTLGQPKASLGQKIVNTGSALKNLVSDLPTQTKGYIANLAEGSHPLDENNWADNWAKEASDLSKKRANATDANDETLIGTKGEWANTGASIPFSVGSLVGAAAGTLTGGAATAGNPIGAFAGGALGAGALAKRADSAMFMRNALDGYTNKYQQENNGKLPTQKELLAEQERLQPYAQQHGLEEAIPEGIGSAVGGKVIGSVFKGGGGLVKKGLKAITGIAAEELPSETVTQQLQHNTEVDAGVIDEDRRSLTSLEDWGKSAGEVFIPVVQQSLLMGGGTAAASKIYDYGKSKLAKPESTADQQVPPPVTDQQAPPVDPVQPNSPQWQSPEFQINPNADAIVRNRTQQGMGTQEGIDSQYQNDGAYNPLAGQWETPTATLGNQDGSIGFDEQGRNYALTKQAQLANAKESQNEQLKAQQDLETAQQTYAGVPTKKPNSPLHNALVSSLAQRPAHEGTSSHPLWDTPNATISPDADAIVKNRTVQGMGVQNAINAQTQNQDAYNPYDNGQLPEYKPNNVINNALAAGGFPIPQRQRIEQLPIAQTPDITPPRFDKFGYPIREAATPEDLAARDEFAQQFNQPAEQPYKRAPIDERINTFGGALQNMANDLQVNGGIVQMPDGRRTPSLNMTLDWFNGLRNALPNADLTPAGVQKAVNKAVEGKSLGKNEAAIVTAMLDYVSEQQPQSQTPETLDDAIAQAQTLTQEPEPPRTPEDDVRDALERIKPHLSDDDFENYVEDLDRTNLTEEQKAAAINSHADDYEKQNVDTIKNEARNENKEQDQNQATNRPTADSGVSPQETAVQTEKNDAPTVDDNFFSGSNRTNSNSDNANTQQDLENANDTFMVQDGDGRTDTARAESTTTSSQERPLSSKSPNQETQTQTLNEQRNPIADVPSTTEENASSATTNQETQSLQSQSTSENNAMDNGNNAEFTAPSQTQEQRAFEPTHQLPSGEKVALKTDDEGNKYFAEEDGSEWDYTDSAKELTNEQENTPSDLGNGSNGILQSQNNETTGATVTPMDSKTASDNQADTPMENRVESETQQAFADGNKQPSISNDGQTTSNETAPVSVQQDADKLEVSPQPILSTNGKPVTSFVGARGALKKQGLFDSHEVVKQDDGSFIAVPKAETNVQAAKNENSMPVEPTWDDYLAQKKEKEIPNLENFAAWKAKQSAKNAQSNITPAQDETSVSEKQKFTTQVKGNTYTVADDAADEGVHTVRTKDGAIMATFKVKNGKVTGVKTTYKDGANKTEALSAIKDFEASLKKQDGHSDSLQPVTQGVVSNTPADTNVNERSDLYSGDQSAKNAQSNNSEIPNSSIKLPTKTSGRIESLTDLANIAVSRKGINKAFSEINVSPDVAQKIKEKVGIDVTGWVHGIDEDSIRHIFKQHGNESTEKARGQIAVTSQDIASIKDIVENPDDISKGKDINGLETVIFKKTFGDTAIYVQEIRVGKQKLAAKTLWKIPVAPTATADNAGELHTSETFNAHNSQGVDNLPKTDDIYNRSNRSNQPDDEQKSALVAKGGVTGRNIQDEKQRLDLTTFSENADVKALGFDAKKLKEAEHLIEQIAETALNRKQSELNEQELAKDLEKLAQDPKNGISIEQMPSGAMKYTMTVDGKKMSFTRQPDMENLDSKAREQVDELRNKLVEIGAGEWDVASLTMHVQPLDETAVDDMRARARNTANNAATAESKMKAASQARKAYLFFDSVMKKLKNVFYGLFQSISSNPQKAKELDDTKLYKWRSSDNTVMFTVQKGRANFKVFDDNKNIKGNSPAERKSNVALKAQLLDEIASIQAAANKRGKIQAATSESNKPVEVNAEVARMLAGHPVLQSLFEPVEAGTFAKNFEGFTAAKGDDFTPPSKSSEPAPNNPQQPVEKSPENEQVADDVSKKEEKIDTLADTEKSSTTESEKAADNVTTQNADTTSVTEENQPVSSPPKAEQVKTVIENATPETKAAKENGNLIVGTIGFDEPKTKGNTDADTTRASVSNGDVSTATNEPRVSVKQPRPNDASRTRKSRAGLQAGQRELIEANHVASWADELPTDERVVGHETDAENQRPIGRENGTDGSVSKSVGAHNFSLIDKPAISLTPAKRRDVNALAEKILEKPISEVTEADKEILRQYTGVGGLNTKDQVDKGAGIFNQHYTHYDTIKSIYGALEQAGVKMDYILEPSVGSGNFIGMHPNAEWVAVDIDKTSTEIVKRLYPDATVHHQSYEDFNGKDFDLIISNVPFASFADLPREKHTTVLPAFKAIHNFFFAHSMDKLKEGGVMAFMTSTGTMDGTKEAAKLRASLIKKADVIGAYRLPMGTQKENASTDVMIDLIFLQKRPEGVESKQPEKNQSFVETTQKDGHKINKYFVDYPDSVLGDLSVGTIKTAMGGKEGLVVTGTPKYENIKVDYQDYKTSKKSDVSGIQFNNYHVAKEYADKNGLEFVDEKQTPFFKDGVIYDMPFKYHRSDDGGIFGRKLTGVFADKMAALQAIDENPTAEAVNEYKEKYELSPHNDKKLQSWAKNHLAEKQLKSYQALFDKDFNLSERFTKQVRFENSGKIEVTKDSPLLDRAESLEDADGFIIINKTDGLISDSEIQTLLDDGKYARVGANSIQNARLYYAGNIYQKIDALDKVHPAEQREKQAKLLEKVKPTPIPLSRISITGREGWLPPEARAAIGISTNADGSLSISNDTISDDFMREIMNNYLNHEQLVKSNRDETPEEYANRIKEAQNLLANEILPIIKQKITDDGLEKQVVESYNRAMNFFAAPVFDGSSLKNLPKTFKGKPFKLMQHQQEGAERAIYNKKGVLAFSPGLGKTPTAIIVAHQLLQKGVVKKPLFIVPANTIHQWESSTKSLYPDAKVFEYPKYKSGKNAGQAKEWQALTAEDKERMVNDLANNQYDYTYISTNLAQKFTVPEAKMSEYVDRLVEQISTMEKPDDELNKKQIKAKQQRLAKLAALRHSMMSAFAEDASNGFDMERLGFDAIFADEVQYYKNIGMQSEDAKGGIGASVTLNAKFPVTTDSNGKEIPDKEANPISVTIGSARSYDFRFKTMYISEKNNGNNIFLLTGTPTPNKPLELLTLLHHMDVNILNEYGIENVGDFVDSFLDLSEVEKEGIDGTVKMETQLTGMKNVDAMKKIITRYVDYRSPESATDLTRPKQIDVNHAILMSDEAQIVFADIQGRVMQAMEDAKAKMQGEKIENAEAIIAMYTAGRDASIDIRLYKPTEKSTLTSVGQTFEEETRADYSKIAKTVQLVAEQLKNKPDSGQLIFLDRLSFPDGGSTHEDIRNKVIAATGLSEKEVVFVNGSQHVNPATGKVVKSNPDLKRLQEIMDAYNANEIKVLIGNTSKLGVGVDLNVHTTDIYQVDKLYRPDEIEQRNNRGVRQGNKNAEVRVHTFNQIGTFDALSDRIIANKQGFNDVFWKDQDSDTVDVKAEEVPSAYDAAIELEKDPYKKRKLEIERDLEHSRSRERGLEKQISNLAGRIRTTQKSINDYVTANNGIDNRPAPEYKDKSPAEREQAIAEFKDRMAEQKAKNSAKIATLQSSLSNLNAEKEARQAELAEHRASDAQMRSKYVVDGVVSIDAIKRQDDIKPSKTQSNANTYTKESLSSELKNAADKEFGKGWLARLFATGKFEVIDSNEAKAFTNEKGVQAFYHNGTTYFVADGIASTTDLIGLLKHEIGIHALKMGKDDAGFKAILKQIEAMRGKNAEIDKAFKAAERAGTSPENLLEETAGYLVEQAPEQKIVQRLLAWLRNAIRKLTGDKFANNLTVNDLNYMAREALRKAPESLEKYSIDNGNVNQEILFAKVPQDSIKLGQKVTDPVKVNGNADLWEIPDEVEQRTKGKFPAKPIRLLMGKHFNEHRGFGLAHIEAGHKKEIEATGMTVEQWVVSVIQSADKILDEGNNRLLLRSSSSPIGNAYVELRKNDGFYSVVTAFKGDKRGKIVWSGRRQFISSQGSEVSGIKNDTFATTTGLPINPTVGTEALANTSSAQAREALTDQTTGENIPENPDDSIKFSKRQPASDIDVADDYELNRQNVKSKKQHLKDMSARFGKEAAHGIGNFLGSARTRLENISPKLGAKYIQLEHDIAANEAKAVKAVKPFMDKTKTMSKSDVIDFDFAAKNNDSAKIDELVSKYNMQSEYNALLDALASVNEDAKSVGMAVNDGIPKVLRDTNGFLDAIGEGVFTKRLKEYAADMGLSYDELTLDQKVDIVNNMIKTGSHSIKKDIGGVTPELNQYFMGTNAAILSHIHEITKHTQYRKFLGGISQKVRKTQKELEAIQSDIAKQENLMTNAKTDDAKESARQKLEELKGIKGQLNAILLKYALQNDYHENVASYIMKAIAEGEIKPSDERIVQEVLNARLHEKGATGVTAAYKNLSLIDTMGSPISAITQIGDFTWALYESGNLFRGLKAINNARRKNVVFDKTDFGLERIAQEFTESDTFAGAVDKVFKWVGIKYVTGVASDSLLNAISDKLTRQAQANDSRLMDKLKTYFDDDANQVLEDLKNGVINDNTRLMIYSRYLDFAPVAMSELPIKYQTAGNGRVMYMLKTYTLKLFDIYRREAVKEIFSGDKQRAIQGMKNLTMILALLMLTGAGGDELKDWLLGRNTDFDDRVIDNLWKLAGLSKFITWQVRREGLGTAALKQILPPFAFVNAVGNDVMHATDINRHPKNEMWVNGLETTNSIPVVGKLVYWNFGRGTQKHKELSEIRFTKEKQKLNDIKDELEQLEGEEKKQFYSEHKADLWRLKQAGRVQASANRLKEIINKQRAMPKSDEREAIISNLESKRNTIISNFVGMN